MKKKELKELAKKVAAIEFDESISRRKKEEQISIMLSNLSMKDLMYIDELIEKENKDYAEGIF